jgi:hypothetical protein
MHDRDFIREVIDEMVKEEARLRRQKLVSVVGWAIVALCIGVGLAWMRAAGWAEIPVPVVVLCIGVGLAWVAS